MRHSTKAALLSGLVFPGVGHLYLKRYLRGALLAAAAGALSYFLVSAAVNSAFDVVGKIQSGDVPPNVESLSALVSKASQANENWTDIATWVLLALWVFGIADSYREGRARDRSKEPDAKT